MLSQLRYVTISVEVIIFRDLSASSHDEPATMYDHENIETNAVFAG